MASAPSPTASTYVAISRKTAPGRTVQRGCAMPARNADDGPMRSRRTPNSGTGEKMQGNWRSGAHGERCSWQAQDLRPIGEEQMRSDKRSLSRPYDEKESNQRRPHVVRQHLQTGMGAISCRPPPWKVADSSSFQRTYRQAAPARHSAERRAIPTKQFGWAFLRRWRPGPPPPLPPPPPPPPPPIPPPPPPPAPPPPPLLSPTTPPPCEARITPIGTRCMNHAQKGQVFPEAPSTSATSRRPDSPLAQILQEPQASPGQWAPDADPVRRGSSRSPAVPPPISSR